MMFGWRSEAERLKAETLRLAYRRRVMEVLQPAPEDPEYTAVLTPPQETEAIGGRRGVRCMEIVRMEESHGPHMGRP